MEEPLAPGAEDLLRRVEALDAETGRTRNRTELYQRMAAQLRAVRGTAASEDGVVTITAAPGGTVTDVVFAPSVRHADPRALSAVVLHTVATAQANAAALQAEVVRANFGDTELLDRVLREDQLLFGDPPPRPGPTPASAHPPPSRIAGEDEQELGVRVVDDRQSW